MKLLLDSHVLLWWLEASPRLSTVHRAAISDPSNDVHVSAATLWELAIKVSKGKLILGPDFPREVLAEGFIILPVTADHAWGVRNLRHLHGDPFDRALLVQAQMEDMLLATRDPFLLQYSTNVLRP